MNKDLTAEEVRSLLDYDPATGLFFWKLRRSANSRRGWFRGCDTGKGYLRISINNVPYRAHRLAWLHHHGHWPAVVLDHIDGNPGNNAIANLREATMSENMRNRRLSSNNKTGVTGLHQEANGRWVAQIGVGKPGRKQIHLGRFRDKAEAIRARREAEIEYFGQFVPRTGSAA